jgi:hypothetical protein
MAEDLFCAGQKVLSPQGQDNWYRTFRGHPDMNTPVKKMLREFAKNGEFAKALIFFTGECGFDNDYSEFLVRELALGNI